MASPGHTSRFRTSIREVAVIGAGISGVASAAHLLRQGLSVTVFERSAVAGGVWHYDPRVAPEPPYPNEHPPLPLARAESGGASGSASCSGPLSFDDVSLAIAPPGPCYEGLRNNVPTPLMRSTMMDWPNGTPDYVSHDAVEKYVQDLSAKGNVHSHTLYSTSVEDVSKGPDPGSKWRLRTRNLRRRTGEPGFELTNGDRQFDAVVVASGHYDVPRIPDIPGLKEWKEQLPDNVMHTKQYRSPEPFRGMTVLLIGAGVSALDVARECDGVARRTYQSTRNGKHDIPASMLPARVRRAGPIDKLVRKQGSRTGDVLLQDGQVLRDIDIVILATGYITSYPFLGARQAPSVAPTAADDKVIITADGCITHNLHKDMFYIPDPSLAFVGVLYHGSAFSLYDFQAKVVARVLAGKAELPGQEAMRAEYAARRPSLLAGGTSFHSVMQQDVQYMSGILEWVNRDAAKLGHEAMKGVDDRWLDKYHSFLAELEKRGLVAPRGKKGTSSSLRHIEAFLTESSIKSVKTS